MAASMAFPVAALGKLVEPVPEKALSFLNLHTGERLKNAIFWAEGDYIPETLNEINYLFRDHYSNEVSEIDPELMDILFVIRRKAETDRSFNIISGYRSPETNQNLRRTSNKVAKNSLHMQGQASDIRLPGCSLRTLRKIAISLKRGGVGYYPSSNFIHVDTGPVRSW